MCVDVVGRADQGRFTEIGTARKQRVESLQVRVARIVIAAGDIRFKAEPRFEGSIGKGEADIGCAAKIFLTIPPSFWGGILALY
jgi:hypothetical protein